MTLDLDGSCIYNVLENHVFFLDGTLNGPAGGLGPCGSGVYTGSAVVNTRNYAGGISVELFVAGPTATIVGQSGDLMFAMAGELATTGAPCPNDGIPWTGVLAVEDPTLA